MLFYCVGHVGCTAVAHFKVVPVEYLVEFVRFWKMLVN